MCAEIARKRSQCPSPSAADSEPRATAAIAPCADTNETPPTAWPSSSNTNSSETRRLAPPLRGVALATTVPFVASTYDGHLHVEFARPSRRRRSPSLIKSES